MYYIHVTFQISKYMTYFSFRRRRRLAKETVLNIRKSGSATRISGPETRSEPLVRDALAPTSNDYDNNDNDHNDNDHNNNIDDNCNDNNNDNNNYDDNNDNNDNNDNENVDVYNDENNHIRGRELRSDHHDCDNYDAALGEIPWGIFPFNNRNNDNHNANDCEDTYDYINKYGVNDNKYAGIFPHNGVKKDEYTGILPQTNDNFFDIHDDNDEGYGDDNNSNYSTGVLPPYNYPKAPILVSSVPTRKPEYSDIQKSEHIRKSGHPDIRKPEYLDLRASTSSRGILENSHFFDTNKPAVSIGRDMGLGVCTGARDRADASTVGRGSTCVRTGDWWRANTCVPSSVKQTDNSKNIKNNDNDYNTTNFNDYTSTYTDMHDVNDMIPSFSLTHKNVNNYMEKNADHSAYQNPFKNKNFNSNYQNGGNTNSDDRKNEIKTSTRGLL
jgi:hypothetical protein